MVNTLLPSNPVYTRIVSGTILSILVLGTLLLGEPYIQGLVALVTLAMIREWSRLIGNQSRTIFVVYTLILFSFLGIWALGHTREALAGLIVFSLALYCGGVALQQQVVRWLAVGLVYLGVPIMSLLWVLEQFPQGPFLILWVIGVIATNDTCAYFTGRALGGPKLAPRISPGKTWSGLAGGLLGAAVLGFITALVHGAHQGVMVGAALTTALLGNFGDLLESAFKRHFHVKDTGNAIPGHGGFLDRCDSILGAIPGVALFLWLSERGFLGDLFRAFVLGF